MARKKSAKEREKYSNILKALETAYPDAKPGLDFTSPFELLIATILSAQCTDKQVNKVTPALFADYPDAKTIAQLTPEQLAPYIKSCGFYATKSKNIVATCRILTEQYGGEVPADRDVCKPCPAWGVKRPMWWSPTLLDKMPLPWIRMCFAWQTGWAWPRQKT